MHRKAWLGAFALGILLAVPASADVRRAPLHVEWVGPLPTLSAGRPLTGAFRFVSSNPVQVTNVRLEGPGWDASLLDTDGRLRFAAAGAQQVRFRATAADPKVPLVLHYEADGVAHDEPIDFASATAVLPSPLEAVRVGSDATRSQGDAFKNPGAIPSFGGMQVRRSEDFEPMKAAPTSPQQVTARNIRVHGRFVYYRSDATTIGVDGATVRIKDGGSDLAVVATDAFGWYDVTFYWNPCSIFCHSNPDIHVEFASANTKVNVRTTGIFGGTYSWSSGTTPGYTGSDLDEGWQTPSDETQHPSLEILTDVTRDWRWYLNYEGYDQTPITMYWPDGPSGAYYDDGEQAIHVGDDRKWREDTHAHEYGHHWIYTFAVGQTPDYCNGICDSPSGCGHCMWCQETDHDAWNEGWPNWIAHVQTVSYASDYGIAALNVRDQEFLQNCTSSLDNPWKTEGFIGALMQDIWDSNNEDDPASPGTWRDQLSLGPGPIFTVTDLDAPLTPYDFLVKFKNRYPWLHEQLWETAMNNTYDMDTAPPSAVTGLTSPTHAISVSSPNAQPQFTWTRADDDWSGPAGYSIVLSGSPTLPDAIMDIGDVTTWTSGPIAPGTYYFSIRTVDRDGRWGAGYAWYGPIIVRLPEPANLTYYLFAGWGRPVVPRGAADGTFGSVPDPATLPGDLSSTYWNVGGWNAGESSTSVGFVSRCYVDDNWLWWFSWGPIGSHGGFYGNNGGPMYVTGGRHVFETRYDSDNAIAETIETDNRWGHQWAWTPSTLPNNGQVTRGAPPIKTAGWGSVVDGSPLYYDQDGLRFNTLVTGSWWHAVYEYALDLTKDYDINLSNPTSSASSGFDGALAYSGRLAGSLDAVVVNRNVVSSPTTFDAGIINYTGAGSNYVAKEVASVIMSYGDSVNVSMADGEMMLLREFYLAPANTGAVSITAKIISGTGPVYVQWRNQGFTEGSLLSYDMQATADGSTMGRIDATMSTAGWQGICLYRDPSDGTGPVTVVLEISQTPPDFTPYYAAGWHAPFVPRPANDGLPGSVPVPDTLYGNVASTYLNLAVTNNSPTGASGLLGQVFLDGIYTWWLAYGFFPGYAVSPFNWGAAWNVRGGRHTLSVYYDAIQAIEERYEDNNIYGEQYVWSPQLLAASTPVTRGAPPDKIGGWDQVRSGEPLYYDSDGLRMPQLPNVGADNFWGAIAVMPGASSDVDIRLHEVGLGAKSGFDNSLTISGWGTGQSDYCLVNFNRTPRRPFDAGAINWIGSQPYTAEVVGSQYLGAFPSGIYGPYTVAPGHIMNLHEVYLASGTYAIDVFNVSGAVDWGVTVHPTDQTFQYKSTAVGGGLSYFNGPGASELTTCSIPIAGYYCIAVWKAGSADLGWNGQYQLQIRSLTADAPGGSPTRTALAGVYPNPLRDAATVSIELASEGDVHLAVYDLHGARVRTLANGHMPPGKFDLRWAGDDDSGHGVSPGVYFLRFASQGVSTMRRMVKME